MTMTDHIAVVPRPGPVSADPRFVADLARRTDLQTGVRARFRADVPYLVCLGVALLMLTTLPYIWGYASSPSDQQFMGLTFTTHDYAQYLSWARESESRVFVENKLTSEHTEAMFFNPVWWLVGRTERAFDVSFAAVNQAFRVLAGFTFVLVLGAFTATVIAGPERRLAIALACVTSGFGWILVVAKQVTGELSAPLLVQTFPGNTFFGMMVVPHMILSASMLIGIFALMLESYRRGCGRRALLAGVVCLGLGFAHPYNIVTAYAVVGAFAALMTLRDGVRPRWVLALAAFYMISAPSVLYWMWVSASSAAWREVLAQYRNLGVFTPDPPRLLVLLGPITIMAALGLRGLRPLRERGVGELFVVTWLAVNLVIIYLPFEFQINLLNGIQVPLAVLAAGWVYRSALPWLATRLPTRQARLQTLLPILVLALVVPTNVYLLSWRIVDLGRHSYPDYLYRDDVAALAWLERAAAPSDAVLSSMVIGHYVPGLTGAHAFLGSGVNTLDFYAKRAAVERFFAADTSDVERQRLLVSYGIGYVFHGPAERALGAFEPSSVSYLEAVFTSSDTAVYRVVSAADRR
jgi:hypothetical protein